MMKIAGIDYGSKMAGTTAIAYTAEQQSCLVHQIVGPIVRRVAYWLEEEQAIERGERIGIMKFGSRLDMYFPSARIEVLVEKGNTVRAGITPVVRFK